MEPSAPPLFPLRNCVSERPDSSLVRGTYALLEMAIPSWKVRRRASWASAPHSFSNKLFWRSSRTANREQQAALVAVFLPSGQATRLVKAAIPSMDQTGETRSRNRWNVPLETWREPATARRAASVLKAIVKLKSGSARDVKGLSVLKFARDVEPPFIRPVADH